MRRFTDFIFSCHITISKKMSAFALLIFIFLANIAFASESDSTLQASRIIDRIIITGNNKTKANIITRELVFHEGDTLSDDTLKYLVERSRENLMNINLFNFVDIHIYQAYQGHVDIHIDCTERWYLFPLPIFEIADRNFNEWWDKRDFNRVNYGVRVKQENFRGRDEILQGMFIFGYSQRLGLFYDIPYINRKQSVGLTLALYGTRNHEIVYDTYGNKLQFYKNPDKFVRNDLQGYVRLTKRKGVYNYYSTTIDFRTTRVDDTIPVLNPDYFVDDAPKQNHLGISWAYRYDRRDYQTYANKGYLFEFEANKTGSGLLKHEPNLVSITAGFRKYQTLNDRFSVAAAVKGRVSQRPGGPYFNQRALGYLTDYIRGYDYYVINGQDYGLLHSTLRFALLPTRIYQLPVINSNKFKKVPLTIYLTGFYDSGYVRDKQFGYKNPLSNSYQYGYGGGLDLVTYYSLVFRIEYAFNKLGDNGIFFHIGTIL